MKNLTQKEWIAVGAAVAVVALFFVVPRLYRQTAKVPTVAGTVSTNSAQEVMGTGAAAKVGDTVTVNYIGMFTDGTIFDSSIARNMPLTFTVGDTGLIKGFNLGVVGMKAGGVRRVTIPPSLAYGSVGVKNPKTGAYVIAPNTTLIFELHLISVK